jgi:putative membrane protein
MIRSFHYANPVHMKKFNFPGSIFLNMYLFTALLFVCSCNNQKAEDPKDIAEDHNDAKFDNKDQEKDAQFLVEAASINLEEIQLSQLAQQKSSMADVKMLGKMLEEEHTKSLTELQALASKKSVTIPTAVTDKDMDDYKRLSNKSGHDFDKDYCDEMVEGHKKAIEKFKKAATDCADSDIKAWASSTLPTLRSHLDQALNCQKKCE